MILVDTSAWVAFFRDERGADLVDAALDANQVALCGPVATELRRGLGRRDSARVLELLEGCVLLEQPDDLWRTAGELGRGLRTRGTTVKTLDLLIAVYALTHATPILTLDSDFSLMRRAGVALELVTIPA